MKPSRAFVPCDAVELVLDDVLADDPARAERLKAGLRLRAIEAPRQPAPADIDIDDMWDNLPI